MPRKKDTSKAVIDAAFELAAETSWHRVSLAGIAKAANLPLAEMRALFPAKVSIVIALMRQVDQQVLDNVEPFDPEDSPRDRLFDVLMQRFDALTPYKKGITSSLRGIPLAGPSALCAIPQVLVSMAWMLEAAGIDSSGLRGLVRTKGLALVYGAVFKAWLTDDSADMAKTMAALDSALGRVEAIVSRCPRCGIRRPIHEDVATVS